MKKIGIYFAWLVIVLYFVLGSWVLFGGHFSYMSNELRVVFALFLYLYGGFRAVRLWTKYREKREE